MITRPFFLPFSLPLISFYVLYSVMDKVASWTFCTTNMIRSKYIWGPLLPRYEVAAVWYFLRLVMMWPPTLFISVKSRAQRAKPSCWGSFWMIDYVFYLPCQPSARLSQEVWEFPFSGWSDKSTEWFKHSIFLQKFFFHLLCHNQTLFNDVRCLGSSLLPFV